MSVIYGRLSAIRDYWIARDQNARVEVRVTDLDEILRELAHRPLTDSPWVQRQTPFTDSQIDAILDHAGVAELPPEWDLCGYEIARAIEAAHGIK